MRLVTYIFEEETMSFNFYDTTWRNIPEGSHLQVPTSILGIPLAMYAKMQHISPQ
jgi:hypothetical protein